MKVCAKYALCNLCLQLDSIVPLQDLQTYEESGYEGTSKAASKANRRDTRTYETIG